MSNVKFDIHSKRANVKKATLAQAYESIVHFFSYCGRSVGKKFAKRNSHFTKTHLANGYRLGRMVKADDYSPRGPGIDSYESLIFFIYSMDVMINAPIACLTLNRLQKSDGRT